MNISEYERKVIKNIKTATLKAADKKLKCRNFVGFFCVFKQTFRFREINAFTSLLPGRHIIIRNVYSPTPQAALPK